MIPYLWLLVWRYLEWFISVISRNSNPEYNVDDVLICLQVLYCFKLTQNNGKATEKISSYLPYEGVAKDNSDLWLS